jgi:hypothetical protein
MEIVYRLYLAQEENHSNRITRNPNSNSIPICIQNLSSESRVVSDCTSSCWFPHARSRLPLAHGVSVYQLRSSYLDPIFGMWNLSVRCRRSSESIGYFQSEHSTILVATKKIKCASHCLYI